MELVRIVCTHQQYSQQSVGWIGAFHLSSSLPSSHRTRRPCPSWVRVRTAEHTGARLDVTRGSETCSSSGLCSLQKTESVFPPSPTHAVRLGFAKGKGDRGRRRLRFCMIDALERARRGPAKRWRWNFARSLTLGPPPRSHTHGSYGQTKSKMV